MKMNRRNVIVGLGTIVAGGGAALGTGAFTTVEADRTVSVSKVGDNTAFLQFGPGRAEYSGFVDSSGGEATIDIGNMEDDHRGLNENALTAFDNILAIGNAGSNEVQVSIDAGDGVEFYTDGYPNSTTDLGVNSLVIPSDPTLQNPEENIANEAVKTVGIVVDLRGSDAADENIGSFSDSATVTVTASETEQ